MKIFKVVRNQFLTGSDVKFYTHDLKWRVANFIFNSKGAVNNILTFKVRG